MQGNRTVEQVDAEGNIVEDKDTSISRSEIYERIAGSFPDITQADGIIYGSYCGRRYAIRAKNITYLGNPHPPYKKRIQIPDDLRKFYDTARANGAVPILLGVYTYQDCRLFCDFAIEDFIYKKAHNSSAHVHTEDLAAAVQDGIFQKTDAFGNRITVFTPQCVPVFLEQLLSVSPEREASQTEMAFQQMTLPDAAFPGAFPTQAPPVGMPPGVALPDSQMGPIRRDVIEILWDFFGSIPRVWDGIDCYRQMIEADYRNKFQPEWAGFYLEFLFENYLSDHHLEGHIRYAQDKSAGGVDLDLYFPQMKCYGDLKCHSASSRGIQGNDWNTVQRILAGPDGNHVFYIVCEHDTIKDSALKYAVTQFWNRAQHKEDLMSYHKRMKGRVILKQVYLLDIHAGNAGYLSMFKQGVNSNGKLREPKIMIDMDQIAHFVIASLTF